MLNWIIRGNIGEVKDLGGKWLVKIAENSGDDAIWFHVITYFEPKAKKGDLVLAYGVFSKSYNKKFNFNFRCLNMSILLRKGENRNASSGEEKVKDKYTLKEDKLPENPFTLIEDDVKVERENKAQDSRPVAKHPRPIAKHPRPVPNAAMFSKK